VGIVYNSFDMSLDNCLPCVLYLCNKYHDSPAKALTASANLGGDSSNRTALVGAIMGGERAICACACLHLLGGFLCMHVRTQA